VLGRWSREEEEVIHSKMDSCIEIIKAFTTMGANQVMTKFNRD